MRVLALVVTHAQVQRLLGEQVNVQIAQAVVLQHVAMIVEAIVSITAVQLARILAVVLAALDVRQHVAQHAVQIVHRAVEAIVQQHVELLAQ